MKRRHASMGSKTKIGSTTRYRAAAIHREELAFAEGNKNPALMMPAWHSKKKSRRHMVSGDAGVTGSTGKRLSKSRIKSPHARAGVTLLTRIIHEGSRIYAFRWCLVERCKPRLSRKHPVRFLLIVVRSRVGHGSSHRHGDPAREKSIKNV